MLSPTLPFPVPTSSWQAVVMVSSLLFFLWPNWIFFGRNNFCGAFSIAFLLKLIKDCALTTRQVISSFGRRRVWALSLWSTFVPTLVPSKASQWVPPPSLCYFLTCCVSYQLLVQKKYTKLYDWQRNGTAGESRWIAVLYDIRWQLCQGLWCCELRHDVHAAVVLCTGCDWMGMQTGGCKSEAGYKRAVNPNGPHLWCMCTQQWTIWLKEGTSFSLIFGILNGTDRILLLSFCCLSFE